MNYYKQIDSFRFFAAFLVLMAHWLHTVPYIAPLHLGEIGVDFFFVISGFLISYQLFEMREAIEKKNLKFKKALGYFLARRSLRIFPLYYFVVIVATIFNSGEIREAIVWNLSYTSNFYLIKMHHWTSIFSHFWSLSVEEHFYLVWPLAALLIKRKYILYFMLVVVVFSAGFRWSSIVPDYDYFVVYIHTFSCLDLFMYGSLMAHFLMWKKEHFYKIFTKNKPKIFMFIAFVICFSMFIYTRQSPVFKWVFLRGFLGVFFAYLLGILVVGVKGRVGRIYDNKWFIKGGQLSYAIYLIHNFIPGILLEIKKLELSVYINFMIYFIVTVLVSLLLFRFIETPLRKLGNHFKVQL